MGWTTTDIPYGLKMTEVLKRKYTWESEHHSFKVLESSLVKLHTWYAAIERKEKGSNNLEVVAAVVLVRKSPRYPEFSYKAMDEHAGPVERECPEKILKLLTPTTNQYATQWRADCWNNIQKRKNNKNKPLKTGYHIVFEEPLLFRNNTTKDIFYIEDAKRKRYRYDDNYYRLNRDTLVKNKYHVIKLNGVPREDLPTLIGISPAIDKIIAKLINGMPLEKINGQPLPN